MYYRWQEIRWVGAMMATKRTAKLMMTAGGLIGLANKLVVMVSTM